MGFDFRNHHIFVGPQDPSIVRSAIIERIKQLPGELVENENEANRSIVVGPPTRWIFVGDSAGSTERFDGAAFDNLSREFSEIAPTVDFLFGDSSVVHIRLYEASVLIDQFGNGRFPIYRFRNEEQAAPFYGDVDRWQHLLLESRRPQELRRIWDQKGDATQIISETSALFGMNSELALAGYTIFNEADEIRYDAYLSEEVLRLGNFDEYHIK